MTFQQKLKEYVSNGKIPGKYGYIIDELYQSYIDALQGQDIQAMGIDPIFETFINLVAAQVENPFQFAPYHQQILEPFNYYQYGLEFIRPLVDMKLSSLRGEKNVLEIQKLLKEKHNVILLANHQIEADPQAISLLLEKDFPSLGREMIFVAGERVLTDPLASPISMGRNLLCIYSKRYIDHPPELKEKKQLHNKKTMELMSDLLAEGGKCIYVAPSGGRDRPNDMGVVEVAPFDPQSIEMFYLMTKKAKQPTHFYPLSLATFDLLPPPKTIQVELGEVRKAKRTGIHACFGNPINMENYPGSTATDKHARRQARADFICSLVKKEYSKFPPSGAR
ncbi:MAG: glycerol-3-phosphate acyltransferase [Chlamydiae bacterium]|nr:glycerol-3-phosphate acyltransferase [Chlamydiota bacterium]